MTLPDLFRPYIGKRETKGKNRSPEIDAINAFTKAGMGAPYCVSTQCLLLQRAADISGDTTPIPKTASSVAFRNWFIDRQRLTYDPQRLLSMTGAFGGWTNDDGAHGHGFLIEKRYTSFFGIGKKVVAIGTLEANTGPDGGRDGDGFYAKKRKVPIDKGHKLWFADGTGLPGMDYWE